MEKEKKREPLYQRNVRINSPQGINRLLQRVINGLIQDEITEERARAIGYLCNIMIKGLEVGELDARLTEIEEALSNGKD